MLMLAAQIGLPASEIVQVAVGDVRLGTRAHEHDEQSVLAQMREQIAVTPMPPAHRPLPTRLLAERPRALVGASVGIATVTAAAVLALAGASSPPAFAVTTAANGTVTITLNSLSSVDDLNAKLSAAGVHVRVAQVESGCNAPVRLVGSNAPPATLQATPGPGANSMQLSPAPDPGASAQGLTNVPGGHTLVLAASPPRTNVPDGQTLVLAASPSGLQPVGQITQTTAPSCVAPG